MVLRGLLVNLSYIGLIILRIQAECLQLRGIWVVRTMCRSPVMIRRGGFTNPSHFQQLLCYSPMPGLYAKHIHHDISHADQHCRPDQASEWNVKAHLM